MEKVTEQEAVNWRDLCSICGKPVRYWHDYLSESDDIITTTWHRRCAKDYKEWLYKVTHILPDPTERQQYPRIGWDAYFNDYQRRQRSVLDKK